MTKREQLLIDAVAAGYTVEDRKAERTTSCAATSGQARFLRVSFSGPMGLPAGPTCRWKSH